MAEGEKLRSGFDYRDVWREEHRNSFTVAKMLQLDLLSDVKALVEDALQSGQTFSEFREAPATAADKTLDGGAYRRWMIR